MRDAGTFVEPEEEIKTNATIENNPRVPIITKQQTSKVDQVFICEVHSSAVSLSDLLGYFSNTVWQEGILQASARELRGQGQSCAKKWLVLDGPLYETWFESLNTALDDTKSLSFANGERFNLDSNFSFLFEAESLAFAYPSIISRTTFIFHGKENMGKYK